MAQEGQGDDTPAPAPLPAHAVDRETLFGVGPLAQPFLGDGEFGDLNSEDEGEDDDVLGPNANPYDVRVVVQRAFYQRWVQVAEVVQNGFDVNAKDAEGCTVLHWAAYAGHLPMVRMILAHGHSGTVHHVASGGLTPVHRAASGGTAAVLRALMDAGGDVNARTDGGWTALTSVTRTCAGDAAARLAVLFSLPEGQLDLGGADMASSYAADCGRQDLADLIHYEVVARGRWSPLRRAWVGVVARLMTSTFGRGHRAWHHHGDGNGASMCTVGAAAASAATARCQCEGPHARHMQWRGRVSGREDGGWGEGGGGGSSSGGGASGGGGPSIACKRSVGWTPVLLG